MRIKRLWNLIPKPTLIQKIEHNATVLGDISRFCHTLGEYLDGNRIFNTMALVKRTYLIDYGNAELMDLLIDLGA